MVSNRIFVGPEVSRQEDWIQASIQYTGDVFMGGQQLKSWHPLLRPLMFRLLAPMRRLEKMKATARRLLFPVLRAREASRLCEGSSYKPPMDTITWMQERSAHIPTFNFREQSHIQLIIGLAAIHTTGMALTHMLTDLAAYPSYVPALREEIYNVMTQNDGHLTRTSLSHLRLLDSFMKESQRLSPIALTFFTRKTSVPITLSDGFHIPKRTHLTCNEQIPPTDPEVWGELDTFEGFRFARAAENAKHTSSEAEDIDASKLNFTTTSTHSMAFGHGRHACPGRYFAAAEIKVVLCYLLMKYDLRFEGGREGRPENIFFETAIVPDPTVKIELRRRGERAKAGITRW